MVNVLFAVNIRVGCSWFFHIFLSFVNLLPSIQKRRQDAQTEREGCVLAGCYGGQVWIGVWHNARNLPSKGRGGCLSYRAESDPEICCRRHRQRQACHLDIQESLCPNRISGTDLLPLCGYVRTSVSLVNICKKWLNTWGCRFSLAVLVSGMRTLGSYSM